MGHVNRRNTQTTLQGADFMTNRQADARIQIRERFIEQQNIRFNSQCPAQCNTLALTAGKCGRLAIEKSIKSQKARYFLNFLTNFVL